LALLTKQQNNIQLLLAVHRNFNPVCRGARFRARGGHLLEKEFLMNWQRIGLYSLYILIALIVIILLIPVSVVSGHKTWRWVSDDLGFTTPAPAPVVVTQPAPAKAAKPAPVAVTAVVAQPPQRVDIVVKMEPAPAPAPVQVIAPVPEAAPAVTLVAPPQPAPQPTPTFFMGAETPRFIAWMQQRGCRITETYSPVSHKWHCDDQHPAVAPAPFPQK